MSHVLSHHVGSEWGCEHQQVLRRPHVVGAGQTGCRAQLSYVKTGNPSRNPCLSMQPLLQSSMSFLAAKSNFCPFVVSTCVCMTVMKDYVLKVKVHLCSGAVASPGGERRLSSFWAQCLSRRHLVFFFRCTSFIETLWWWNCFLIDFFNEVWC